MMMSSRKIAVALVAIGFAACRSASPPATEVPTPVADPATLAARAALANERNLDIRTIGDRAIAVPPLTVASADTSLAPLGFGLADMLLTDLARSAQITIVERGRMDALLREMKLVDAGLVDANQAPRVGRLLGARRLVVGALVDRGNGELGIDTRMVDAVSGTVAGAVVARTALVSIFDAEKALAYRIFAELGVTLTPAERNAIEQRPTANVNAFLAYSRGVRDEAHAQYASAAANYRAAIRADPGFAPAKAKLDNVQAVQTTQAAPAPEVKADAPKTVAETPAATTETAPAAAPTAPVAAPTLSVPTSLGAAAASLAAGSINPSPAGAIGTSAGNSNGSTSTTSSTQQQQQQGERGQQAQRQPVIATVVINVKQLP
jgi:TolB-like protein